jgi:hypothetical protein
MQTADDIVSGMDQLLSFGFLDGAEALRLLREERLDICGFHNYALCLLFNYLFTENKAVEPFGSHATD